MDIPPLPPVCMHDGCGQRYAMHARILTMPVPPLDEVVSTVGAGDSFNAGVACAVAELSIEARSLLAEDGDVWRQILHTAMRFARLCCMSHENYIPREKAD